MLHVKVCTQADFFFLKIIGSTLPAAGKSDMLHKSPLNSRGFYDTGMISNDTTIQF
jgi:hypothetical protein